jgi:hypothetical protein
MGHSGCSGDGRPRRRSVAGGHGVDLAVGGRGQSGRRERIEAGTALAVGGVRNWRPAGVALAIGGGRVWRLRW